MKAHAAKKAATHRASVVVLDSRRRVCLGKAAETVAEALGEDIRNLSFEVTVNAELQIVLTPLVAVPAREAWLWRNPEALASVLRGIDQAKRGELADIGSFASHAQEPLEET